MDKNEFDAQLRADGYTEIETKTLAPRPANEGMAIPMQCVVSFWPVPSQ